MLNKTLFTLFLAFCFIPCAYAYDPNSPLGHWVTISDKTHDRAAVINIYEKNGKLYGKIIKIFPGNGRDPAELCKKCPGEFKNKRVLGLTFLWGFSPEGDNSWSQGQILDPKEGGIYRSSMKLIDNGEQLKVRGYWGIFWRTQTWIREE